MSFVVVAKHHPLTLLPSSSFIHINDKRHYDVDEDCDRVTRRPVEEDLAGRSPISFHKGRSHPCLAEQFFALSDTYATTLHLYIFNIDLVIVHASRRLYSQDILEIFLKLCAITFQVDTLRAISFRIKRHH